MESGATLAGEMLVLEIPVKDPSFDLTKVVCSHGLFMMAPNQWDPASSTLQRPIRLPSGTVRVRISHPRPPGPIAVSVAGTSSLSFEDEQALLDQVRRMLRISDDSDRFIQEFHRIHAGCRERGLGRIFRSPTLFEDMVKCILLCNCQWPRTLSMARALCELHLQLKQSCNSETFLPKTPQQREQKRKNTKRKKEAVKLETKFIDGAEFLKTPNLMTNHITQPTDSCNSSSPSQPFNDELKFSEVIGDFPTPEELAPLDAAYLADCCKLGYRAQRIISLAQSIVDGTLQLGKLEELCEGYSLPSYDSIDQKLSALSGFGPFTRANVLMCMGFYHRVPADTETVRHIRQVCLFYFLFVTGYNFNECLIEHVQSYGRNCDIKSVQEDIEVIYGKYAPFQFLAYWIELWDYYEERFGTWSKLPASYYPLVTASNMKGRIYKGLRVKKAEPEEQ